MGASPQILVLPEEDRTNNAIHLDETRQPAIHGGLSRFQGAHSIDHVTYDGIPFAFNDGGLKGLSWGFRDKLNPDGSQPKSKLTMHSLALISEPTIDPVCGMTVDPSSAAGSFVHGGETYHFCSRHCLDKFRADPERFLKVKSGEQNSCCAGETSQIGALEAISGLVHLPDASRDHSKITG